MPNLSRLLVVAFVASLACASSGDRSLDFISCVAQCESDKQCLGPTPSRLTLPLRLTRWTCSDNCKYNCMHEITDKNIESGERVHQYYGKWPFWRFLGMQEPASVAFSLLNLWAHAKGGLKVRNAVPIFHPMRSYYLIWCLASINAWTWSSVFHTRDLPTTEKLDYFSAALAILYALYYTLTRLLHLYQTPQQGRLTLKRRVTGSRILGWLCTIVYLCHISYLTLLPRFDYTYNMAFNICLGIFHNVLWLAYSLPSSWSILKRFPFRPKNYRPSFVNKAAIFVAVTTAATALELLDFPPWHRIIDAHALWHLATVPIAMLWYDFLIEDSLDISWREQRA